MISKAGLLSFIAELVTRNPNLGIPAQEDGLFTNLLTFHYLHYIFVFGKAREKERRKGKREKGKGREKGKKQAVAPTRMFRM